MTQLPLHTNRAEAHEYTQAYMPLNTLLQEHTPAYWGQDPDDNTDITNKEVSDLWEETFTYLKEDKGQMHIVNTLKEEYKRDGEFRTPIFLPTLTDEQEDSEEEERYYFYSKTENRYLPPIMNGTHRLYALTLIQEEQEEPINAYVQYGYYLTPEERARTHEDDSEVQPTVRTYIYHVNTDNYVNEDMHDAMFSWLRSFKVNDNLWVDADLSTSQGYRLEDGSYVDVSQFFWSYSETYPKSTLNAIQEAVEAQIDKMYTAEDSIIDSRRPVKVITVNIDAASEEEEEQIENTYKYLMGPHYDMSQNAKSE